MQDINTGGLPSESNIGTVYRVHNRWVDALQSTR